MQISRPASGCVYSTACPVLELLGRGKEKDRQMDKKKEPLKAVGYIRVSSEEQVDGESLGFQQEEIEEHCKREGWMLLNIYAEKGKSGSTIEKRGKFVEMLKDGCSGKFDVLIIWKADRFTRDIETGVSSFYTLKNCGIKIVSLRDGFSSDSDDILNLLQIGIADKYRKDLIAGCVAGQKRKLRRGDPRAFNAKPIAREWDEGKKKFILLPEIAEEWRWVVRNYLKGHGTKTLGREIIKRGHKIPYGATRLLEQMKKGLGDKWTVTFKDTGETFTFPCERIVDEETEKQVLKKIGERKHAPHRKPYKYLLSGKIYCAECEKRLESKPSQRPGYPAKRYYYIHPPSERTSKKCVKTVRVEFIDYATLKEYFSMFSDKFGFEEALKHSLPDDQTRKELIDRKLTITKELSYLKRDHDKIVDKLLTQNLTESLVKKVNAKAEVLASREVELEKDLKQLNATIDQLPSVEEYKENAERMRKVLWRAYTGWGAMEDMEWRHKKQLVDSLFDGEDEEGRKLGVYVRQITPSVYEYEFNSRISQGERFMKEFDDDYYGPETDSITETWNKGFRRKKAAYMAEKKGMQNKNVKL